MRRRRHSHRRGKNHTVRNIVIGCFVMILLFATGYSAFQTNISINVKGNIKEKSRVIRSWTSGSVDDFHNSQYRENIVSVTFLDSTTLPSNVENSWDISEDGKGGVIAYVKINEEDYTKYDLFIGAKDGVIANTDSSWLFFDFTNLENIEFNDNFDTSNTTNMSNMFRNCIKITELNISSFDTSKVTNMMYMFDGPDDLTTQLQTITFGKKFDTSQVTTMNCMFSDNRNLENIDVSGFNTSKVTDMTGMFARCMKTKELDLSSFNTTNVTNMYSMFYNTRNLKIIYVSNQFTTINVTMSSNMFEYDINLVGGNGTTYDSNHIDKEYARIDTASTPGYFTLKQ